MGNQFEETTVVKLGALRSKDLSHSLLKFSIVLEVKYRTPEWDWVMALNHKSARIGISLDHLMRSKQCWGGTGYATAIPLIAGHRVLSDWFLQIDCMLRQVSQCWWRLCRKILKNSWCHGAHYSGNTISTWKKIYMKFVFGTSPVFRNIWEKMWACARSLKLPWLNNIKPAVAFR